MDTLNTLIIISHDIRAVLQIAETVWLLGQDRDEDRNLIPGAYIKKQYDLMAMDLCWRDDLTCLPAFNSLVGEIEAEFQSL